MAIAEDLLTLADRLAHPARDEPEQASFRRAISTAYYALFHLCDNSALWGYSDVAAVIVDTHDAFDSWAKIRTHPAASEYLLSLLIGNKRE
jgi:hypothetical protein